MDMDKEELESVWLVYHHLVPGIIFRDGGKEGHVRENRGLLTALGMSSPLLRSIIPAPEKLNLSPKTTDVRPEEVGDVNKCIFSRATCAVGAQNAAGMWPKLAGVPKSPYLPVLKTHEGIHELGLVNLIKFHACDMDLVTAIWLKAECASEQLEKVNNLVVLRIGGMNFSDFLLGEAVARARRNKTLTERGGLVCFRLPIHPSMFPIVVPMYHNVCLEVHTEHPNILPPMQVCFEGIVFPTEISAYVRSGELQNSPYNGGTSHLFRRPVVVQRAYNEKILIKKGETYFVSNAFLSHTLGVVIHLNLPKDLSEKVAPITGISLVFGEEGKKLVEYDLLDLTENNWKLAGEKKRKGNFDLLVTVNRQGIFGEDVSKLTCTGSRECRLVYEIDSSFENIPFYANLSVFELNIVVNGNGMTGLAFSQ